MIGKFQVIHQHAIRICTSWNTQSTFSPRWSVKISADSGTYLQQAKASTSKGPFAATGGQCRRDKFDYSIHSSWFRMLIVITSMFFSFCWYIFFLYIYIWSFGTTTCYTCKATRRDSFPSRSNACRECRAWPGLSRQLWGAAAKFNQNWWFREMWYIDCEKGSKFQIHTYPMALDKRNLLYTVWYVYMPHQIPNESCASVAPQSKSTSQKSDETNATLASI